MPTQNSKVEYKYGTQSQFDALVTKDPSTIHVTTDSQRMYLGETEVSRGRWVVTLTVSDSSFTMTADRTSTEILSAASVGREVVAVIVAGQNKYELKYAGSNGYYLFFTGEIANPLLGTSSSSYAYAAVSCDLSDQSWEFHGMAATNFLFLDEQYLQRLSYIEIDLTENSGTWSASISYQGSQTQFPDDITRMPIRLPWIIYINGNYVGTGLVTYAGSEETQSGGYDYLYNVVLASPYVYSDRKISGAQILATGEPLSPTSPFTGLLDFKKILYDETVVPTKTSDLINDSGYVSFYW